MTDRAEVQETREFAQWREALRDRKASVVLDRRIDRLARGLRGDAKAVGGGVMELRVHLGPGYRIYFTYRGAKLIILLCGGDKNSQTRDIVRARELAEREP